MPKNKYDRLYPDAKSGDKLIDGKLIKSPLARMPCSVCGQRTNWFRRDLNARICSEQCAETMERRP